MADSLFRHIPDLAACLLVLGVHFAFVKWIANRRVQRLIWVLAGWVVLSVILSLPPVAAHFPASHFYSWLRGVGIAWGLCSLGVFLIALVWRRLPDPRFHPRRRELLLAAHAAAVLLPASALGFGIFVERRRLAVREVRVPFAGLPQDLDGLRIVQLTDIHRSAFVGGDHVARAVDMANETRAHIAVVTGDLVTAMHDPLDDCLRELARLRADAGVFGCLGNHEIYAAAEEYTEEAAARLGIAFLRGEAFKLRFGAATFNLVGVDYQRMRSPYLAGAEALVSDGNFNVLLSHNPDVFPVAAGKGFHLTLAGHTHGGQVAVELLNESWSVARFFTPYVYGLYRRAGAAAYVSRGIGTVGVPARIGAPPEVSLIQLCAT